MLPDPPLSSSGQLVSDKISPQLEASVPSLDLDPGNFPVARRQQASSIWGTLDADLGPVTTVWGCKKPRLLSARFV